MVNYQKHCTGLPLHTLKKKKKCILLFYQDHFHWLRIFYPPDKTSFTFIKCEKNKTSLPPDEAHFSSGHPNFCLA